MRLERSLLAGAMSIFAAAACRNVTAVPDGPGGGCAASCSEALGVGSAPCSFDAPGLAAYQQFVACADEVAGDDPDGGLCAEVVEQRPATPACIFAVEQLQPPCSSAPSTCMAN